MKLSGKKHNIDVICGLIAVIARMTILHTINIRETIDDPNNWILLLFLRYGNNQPAVM